MALMKKESTHWGVRDSRIVEVEIEKQLTDVTPATVNWKSVSFTLFQKGFLRTPHECRERWINHLNPTITKHKWTPY